MDDPEQPPDESGKPIGQPVHRTEVQHAQPSVSEHPEVAWVRVGVKQPGPGGAGEQEPDEEQPGAVPLLLRSIADDL